MKSHSDIFGIAFHDFMNGNVNEKISIHTSVSGIEELPVMYFFRGINELPEWEKIALKMCKGRVLDIGAGTGSHALILQYSGHDVTAIDISPGSVEVMKKRGVKNAVLSDFHEYTDPLKFDTLLFLMNGLGLAGEISKLKDTLNHCKTLLKENGKILLESSDLIYLYEEEDGSALIDLAANYYGEVEYTLSYRNYKGKPFKWLFVDYENLEYIAKECGFNSELIYRGDNYNYLAELSQK